MGQGNPSSPVHLFISLPASFEGFPCLEDILKPTAGIFRTQRGAWGPGDRNLSLGKNWHLSSLSKHSPVWQLLSFKDRVYTWASFKQAGLEETITPRNGFLAHRQLSNTW